MTEFFLKPSQNRHTEDLGPFFRVNPKLSGCMMNTVFLLQNLRFIGEVVW